MLLSEYLKKYNITKQACADALDCSENWVFKMCAGRGAGKKMSEEIVRWTVGEVSQSEALFPERFMK